MTEPSPNPAEPPVPPAAYPDPAYQPGPPPAYQPVMPPAYPPGAAPEYPSSSAPPYPAGYPGQPTAYPVSGMPASGMPVSAYPPMYAAPTPSAGVSPWIWVLAAVSAVLLLAAGGLGLAYAGAQQRISDLEQSVAKGADDLNDVRGELEETQAELDDAQACLDAFDAWWLAPVETDDDEWQVVVDTCH